MHLPKLYLLTDESPLLILIAKLDKALATGCVALLQIRRKHTPLTLRHQEFAQIIAVANYHGVPVVINDDVALAADFGVGVHLGQSDGDVVQARQILGKIMIGRTCHNSLDLVEQSLADGADYVAMGAIFASKTKPNAKPMLLGDDDKRRLIKLVDKGLKLCVIGGIELNNVQKIPQILPVIPEYIAVTADIMAQPLDKIAYHCQKWQEALQIFNLK